MVIDDLMQVLGTKKLTEDVKAEHAGVLSSIQWRVNASVAKALRLAFLENTHFRIGPWLSRVEFAERYYAFYKRSGMWAELAARA
jgi:hypothetical protein